MDNKFEQKWLDEALSQCATELSAMLKSEEAALAKSAVDDAPAEESEGSEGPSAPPPSDDTGEESASPEGSAPVGGEVSAPDDGMPPQEEASAPDAGAAPGEEQAIEPAPSVEALQAEYVKLDPEALKMHYLAAKAALMATMGQDTGAPEASAPGAGAPPPAAAPAGPPPGAAPLAMAAKKPNGPTKEENDEWEGMKTQALLDSKKGAAKLGKAESEIASLRAQLDAQNTALLQLAEVVATPIRKSIKGLSDLRFIERTEEGKAPAVALTKKEVQTVLSEQIRAGKLSKADKALVMQYSVGSVDVSKIEHLLANAK
jgi:hypothetical protein